MKLNMEKYQGSKKQFYNCIRIDELLRNKTYPSVKTIMGVLELSERQVLRIIKDMKEIYNAPIEYDKEHKGYCYLLDGFSISDISLDENESFALQVCNSFARKVFGGSKLFDRLYKGLSSLQNRAELFDNDEGKALADRIHFAFGTTNMGFELFQKQDNFEQVLLDSIKNGQLINLSYRLWKDRKVQRETVLPLILVMHEEFSWLLLYIKASAFSSSFNEVNLNLENFGLISFSDITAINIYKDSHAKTVTIPNEFSYFGNSAADKYNEPNRESCYEKKGISFGFRIAFPDMADNKPYNVIAHFELNSDFEYEIQKGLLDGAYHCDEDPFSSSENTTGFPEVEGLLI